MKNEQKKIAMIATAKLLAVCVCAFALAYAASGDIGLSLIISAAATNAAILLAS